MLSLLCCYFENVLNYYFWNYNGIKLYRKTRSRYHKRCQQEVLIAYTLANIKGRLFSIKNNGNFYRILETLKKREFYLGTPKYAMNC